MNSAHCCMFIYLCNEDTCIQIHAIWSTTLNNEWAVFCISREYYHLLYTLRNGIIFRVYIVWKRYLSFAVSRFIFFFQIYDVYYCTFFHNDYDILILVLFNYIKLTFIRVRSHYTSWWYLKIDYLYMSQNNHITIIHY